VKVGQGIVREREPIHEERWCFHMSLREGEEKYPLNREKIANKRKGGIPYQSEKKESRSLLYHRSRGEEKGFFTVGGGMTKLKES